LLPDTSGQKWHYISQVWSGDPNGFYFVHTFEKNVAYVAMRAPYLPAYNEAYLKSIAGKNGSQLVTVGHSELGQPLFLVEIGGATATKSKPCVLIYAREHGTESDSSFIAQGAINFLISDDPQAQDLRSRFVFFVIPLFDVDAAAEGRYENMIFRFSSGMENQEAVAWARFFASWVREGNRIDVVLDLHNVESAGSPHLMCPTFGQRGRACGQLHHVVVGTFRKTIYMVDPDPRFHGPGALQGRLGGWLERYFGALLIPYEANSQDSTRHLTIAETRDMGRILVLATTKYLSSHKAKSLFERIDEARGRRAQRWAKYGAKVAHMNELEAEIRCEEFASAPPTQPTAGANP
jgi:hypothetical protein